MSNLEGKTFYEKVTEWSVPLRDGKATARDVSDLFRQAEKTCRELTPESSEYDDAFLVEADDESLKVQFRSEWKP